MVIKNTKSQQQGTACKALFAAFIFLSFTLKSQFYNLPNDYFFSLLTQKQLAAKDSALHPANQPYIHFFSNKYIHVEDSHRIFRYIKGDPALETTFFKHLIRIEPASEKFKLRLDPLLNLELGKDFSKSEKPWLMNNTRGFIGSGQVGDNVYFETVFAETQSLFPDYISDNAKATAIVPGQGRWKTYRVTGYDYAFSSGFISLQPLKNLNIQLGHGKQKIGNGYRSLLLSDNSFNYPFARITQQWFKGRVQYSNVYAVLMNLEPAAKIQNPNAERLFQKKAASFQYLSANLGKRITLGLFQGMIWQAGDDKNRQHLQWQYFNPVIYTNLAAYGLNNKNNILAGADLKFKLTNKLNIYGQVMADDLSNTKLSGNAWGYQAGMNWFDVAGIRNLFLQLEFNDVKETSYFSPLGTITNQSYSHYNQNLAYTPGSGKELVVISDYRVKRFFFTAKYNYQSISSTTDMSYVNNMINAKIGYVINPAYNLNVSVGINYRLQNFHNFKHLNNETNYIYFGFKTSLYNLYYDF